jgi:methylglyoxal synthase
MATANINTHAFELGDFGKLCKTIPMAAKKNIALVAHDYKKDELLEWAKFNRKLLAAHSLYSTGTTGSILTSQLGLDVTNLQSGPLGGDQQIGSRISEGKIDFLIFFWDPLEAQPHDPDVKALLRIAVVWNVPMACNRATADFVISSALMPRTYDRLVPDYDEYKARPVMGPSREKMLGPDDSEQIPLAYGSNAERLIAAKETV